MADNKPAKKPSALKLKLKSLLSNLAPFKDTIIDTTCYVLGLAALLVLIAKAPDIHNAYLRQVVGSRVYKVQAELRGGGGTGFQVRAPSGNDYVVTNSHVCNHILGVDAPENAGTVLLVDDDGNWIRRKIIVVSDSTDLCLIEGAPGVSGLSLGSEPHKGDTATVVGHPFLKPITLSSGEIIGAEDVKIPDYLIGIEGNPFIIVPPPEPGMRCDRPKNEIAEIALPQEIGGGKAKICLDVTYDAYMTSIIIYPGNSGSPMVDYMGRVIGVAFASNGLDNKGDIVNLSDLKTFLAHY